MAWLLSIAGEALPVFSKQQATTIGWSVVALSLGAGIAYTSASTLLYGSERLAFYVLGHAKSRKANAYLRGNFAPTTESDRKNLAVTEGRIPPELDGCFLRVGPNPAHEPSGDYHWFDGDGFSHCLRIKGGAASYSGRFIRTYRYLREKLLGWPAFMKLGDLRGLAGLLVVLPFAKLKTMFGLLDPAQGGGAAGTALVWHAKRLLTLDEGDLPYHLRVLCEGVVETIGRINILNWPAKNFTAHPKKCPVTGELHFFSWSVDKSPFIRYGALDASGKLIGHRGVELPRAILLHDFGLSAKHAVFLDSPLVVDPENMAKGGGLIRFDNTRPLRIGITPRIAPGENHQELASVTWFNMQSSGEPMPSAVVMHVGNAWDGKDVATGHAVVFVTLCLYKRFDLDITKYDVTSGGDPAGQGDYTMVTCDLVTGLCSLRVLHPKEFVTDFPQIRADRVGQATNRYAYLATISRGLKSVAFDGLIKIDHAAPGSGAGLVARVDFGPRQFGGEAVFIPRPGSTAEDDGWLATYVYDEATETSSLRLYDARGDKQLPQVCRIEIGRRVPYGFHGLWLSAEEMGQQVLA